MYLASEDAPNHSVFALAGFRLLGGGGVDIYTTSDSPTHYMDPPCTEPLKRSPPEKQQDSPAAGGQTSQSGIAE